MAYEVHYTYHEKLDDSGYDLAEEKTMTKRYGKGYEEMPLENLAANVITQLSRRDIWITNVKVYEFVKKEIKFKETKGGGIVLAGRKFTLDGSHSLLAEEDDAPMRPASQIVQPQQMIVSQPHREGTQVPQFVPENRPALRHVVYAPPQEMMEFARVLKLTFNKRYPIFEEKVADSSNMRSGMLYYLRDDLGRGIWVRSFYFQDTIQLAYESELVAPQGSVSRSQTGFVDSVKYESEGAWNIPDIAR